MGFFERLFGKKNTNKSSNTKSPIVDTMPALENTWVDVPAFLPADPEEYELVSIIATSIATGDRPEAQFVVKGIKKRNPEAHLVSVIAASISAGAMPESSLVVKKISTSNQ